MIDPLDPYQMAPWIPAFHKIPSPRGTVLERLDDPMIALWKAVTGDILIREPYLPQGDRYATLVDEYEAGDTLSALAERYGVTKQAIHARLKKRGCAMRPRGGRREP